MFFHVFNLSLLVYIKLTGEVMVIMKDEGNDYVIMLSQRCITIINRVEFGVRFNKYLGDCINYLNEISMISRKLFYNSFIINRI